MMHAQADRWVAEHWQVSKPMVTTTGGLVASQHYLASEVGAKVLRDGGNAVDAAIATGFAISTVEPWMSGLGGGGYMQVYSAAEKQVRTVEFGMISPRRLNPTAYPLTGRTRTELFVWPEVEGDRNVIGHTAMLVPGYVAGMALALATFGTRNWRETLAPAVAMAEAGMPADWYACLRIAANARELSRFPTSAQAFLPGGLPPGSEAVGPLPRLRLGRLAETLTRLAERGPRDFYEGAIARDIAADIAAGGGALAADDLAAYRARLAEPLTARYRDATVFAAPALTGGPSLLEALAELAGRLPAAAGGAPETEAYLAYADILFGVYKRRLESMGEGESAKAPGSTTHITVVDRHGNMVALTQTLLSVFGSKVMLPTTGILMNNGVMWFDPRPGRPNSLAPATRPLTNMCPTILLGDDGRRLALGASGGRRIMPAVFQLLSFVADYGMDLDRAFHQPRIDVSGGDTVLADPRLPPAILAALAARHPVQPATHAVFPTHYACPNAVTSDATGGKTGAAYVMSPWAKVATTD